MKKYQRICGVMAAALAMGMLVGCGGTDEGSSSSADGKEFSYWCKMPSAIVSQYQTMGEVTMYKELEKETGVKINFIHPPAGQEQEQFNLMIASRELPDIIEWTWMGYPGGPQKAVDDNIIIKLNDLMEECAPNLKKALDENSEYDRQAKTDDDTYYAFPGLNVGKYRTFGGIIIRQDWLDELGLQRPETIEEWETVLRAFKEKKGATAPFTGDASLFASNGLKSTFNNAFKVNHGLYMEDGKIKYGPLESGYKEFLTLMNKWYQEGLLDNEYATNNSAAVDAKMTNGSSGAVFGYIGGTIGKYMTAMQSKEPNYRLTACQYPVMNKGDEAMFMDFQTEVYGSGLAITTACKNPKEAAKWADYLYSPEGMIVKNFGQEGVTYNKEGDHYVYTDEILHNPDGLSIAEAMAKHFRANEPSPGYNQLEDYLKQYYQIPEQQEALDVWTTYTDNAREYMLPPITSLSEEAEELSSLNTEVTTYVEEMVTKFINGSEPMENYDKFISTLKSMGVDRILELNQAALDRYNAR
ncbi:extracellular solute-binding protein [Ructibacterium gallinarum]|uniref:Extracellular solute-binding protein n=1 Tax=Ructibacterium gallinarum TaxID=2779355 RepID=A0A9D5M1I0_9FIRM|nr:extracellular solute-binding protein [Ructibacterium gallinarum]MBE5040416.1 extracellular solute-binding protein [Ructibacterium gallinarum]